MPEDEGAPEDGGAPAPGVSPFTAWIARVVRLGDRRVFETGIPMRDGIELSADVYLPAGPGDTAASPPSSK